MKRKIIKKIFLLCVFVCSSVLIILGVLSVNYSKNTDNVDLQTKVKLNSNESTSPNEKNKIDKPTKIRKMTEPEIKREYGKLEILYLHNGKTYRGAVASFGDIYKFVTTDGTVSIPVQDVKMIEIIR